MNQRELPTEITRAIEIAINHYLSKSIVYSPFRIFYNMFKKSNPNFMKQVRARVARDVAQYLNAISNFNSEIFISENIIHPAGKTLLQYCYGVGTNLMKRKLTVRLAFKVMRNAHMRMEIYNYVLNEVRKVTIYVLSKQMIDKPLGTNLVT